MGLQRDFNQSIDLSYASLKEAQSFLSDASENAKDQQVKDKINNSLNQVNQALNECEQIADLMKDMPKS
jgi:chaperonin cofactor prefoldin